MILRDLEVVARRHPWRNHPFEASLFCLGTLMAATISVHKAAHVGVLLVVASLVVGTKIPVKFFLKAMSLPMAFLLAGAIGILVGIRPHPWRIAWEPNRLGFAATVVLRSVSALSCTLLWVATVPFDRMLAVARRCRIPAVVLELSVLVRRSILLFEDAAFHLFRAQVARNGYVDLRASRRSVGFAAANLLARSFDAARRQEEGMASRNGDSVPVCGGTPDIRTGWLVVAAAGPVGFAVLEALLGRG